MKRAGWIALAAGLFLLAFWLGVLANFPSAALTRAVTAQLNTQPGFVVTLEPLRMGPLGLSGSRMTVSEAGPPGGKPLLTLTDLRVPLGLALLRGLSLRASVGESGRVALFATWDGSEIVVNDLSARVEDLIAPDAWGGITVRGQVKASGRFDPSAFRPGPQGQGPGGEIRVQGVAIQIAGISLGGIALPEVRLDEFTLKLRAGRIIQVEQADVRGDAQGKITGAVVLMPGRFADSRVNLTVSGAIRGEWMQKTDTMRPIIEGFFPAGKAEGTIAGTMNSMSWTAAGGRP